MEKVIEILEESLKRVLANAEEETEFFNEKCELREALRVEIAEKERLVDSIAQALPNVVGIPEKVLKERLKSADRRIEKIQKTIARLNEEIETLIQNHDESLEKVKEYEYSIARLKGEAAKSFPPKVWKETACCGGWVKPIETAEDAVNEVSKAFEAFEAIGAISEKTSKAIKNIQKVIEGDTFDLPIVELKLSLEELEGILKESFPTMDDFLKWLYGDKAVKEYQCPHNHTQQMAVVDGTITLCADCRKELVEPSI